VNPQRIQALLDELCIVLGFCLLPQVSTRLKEDPPSDIDAFSASVFRAEGVEVGGSRHLYRQVRDIVAKHFHACEEEKAEPNAELPQRHMDSRPSSDDSPASETPSSPGPRG
jgi:hypothetical protein